MGLIAFTERAPDDNSPFKKNEFHVGKRSRGGDAMKVSQTAQDADTISAASRSTIRRHRQTRPRRGARLGTMVDRNAPISTAGRRLPTLSRTTTEHLTPELAMEQVEHRRVVPAGRPEPGSTRTRLAQDFWVTRERLTRQSGAVTQNLNDTTTAAPEGVASPTTQQAILRDIANPEEERENDYRLWVDGAGDAADSAQEDPTRPRSIQQQDGLSRSVYDVGSDAEENWTSLMETIPAPDGDQPSASSSFASDTASSILSRSRPHSSLTNTTSTSEAAGIPEDSATNCPELRPFNRIPGRTPVFSSPQRSQRRGQVYQESVNNVASSVESNRRLDVLDELMDILNNGGDVPPEMWASVGISPHLGLVGVAGRLRRSERL